MELEIKQLATRSRSGINCEQIVMASFMHADWSSCWPAAAGSGASAMQNNNVAGAKLIFMIPPNL